MHFSFRYIFFIPLLFGCSSSTDEEDLYSFLSICMDEYFLDQGVSSSLKLEQFENTLISEEHLFDNSGEAYKVLLRNLSKEIYFSPPLKFDDFNNALLYKNPPELYQCVNYHYGVDSLELTALKIFSVQENLAQKFSKQEEIKIQEIFDFYLSSLNDNDFQKPYIKDTILLLLYRWYFSSKYNRDIPVDFEELPRIENKKKDN
jgi:hypothetical protein